MLLSRVSVILLSFWISFSVTNWSDCQSCHSHLQSLEIRSKTQHPVRRSAFTHCENELPSRLDNGKSKIIWRTIHYRTSERCQDILENSTGYLYNVLTFTPQLAASRRNYIPFTQNCVKDVLNEIRGVIPSSVILIPLYKLLVYPCLRNRGPCILQLIGIGAVALIL